MIWKSLFGVVGLGSFAFILHSYGISRIAEDVGHLGWWAIPLLASFLPTLFCYSLALLLLTPELGARRIFPLMRLSLVSISWNNLSPFVKVLGEPLRVRMLSQMVDLKSAARSMVLYNIVHLLGTLGSFFLASLLLLLFFPVSPSLHSALITFLVISPLLIFALYSLPHFTKRMFGRNGSRNRLVVVGFWIRWGFSKIRIFSRRHAARFWIAVLLEVLARFVEGSTFYVSFRALGHRASPFTCALLDEGRALLDTIFFFVPYQVGTRETGVVVLAEHGLGIVASAAVSAAVFYRLVEMFWTGVGYVFWIQSEKAKRSST